MREHQRHDRPTNGLFAVCSAREIAAIRRAGTEVTVPAGAVIHKHGSRAQWAYLVLEGQAVVTDEGHRRTLVPGDVHGARSLLAHTDACAELTAQTKLRVLVIDRGQFAALMSRRAGFAHGVARQLAS